MLISVNDEIKRRSILQSALSSHSHHATHGSLADYQALITAMASYLGFTDVNFIDGTVFAIEVDGHYEISYRYSERTETILITGCLAISSSVSNRLPLYQKLLNANVGFSGGHTVRIGVSSDSKYILCSTELYIDGLDVANLTDATRKLLRVSDKWTYDCM